MIEIKDLKNKFTLSTFSLVVSCSAEELQLYQFLKLFAITKHVCFPGLRTIEHYLKWSRPRILRTIEGMKEKRRLVVTVGDGGRNVYDISWYDDLVLSTMKNHNETDTPQEIKEDETDTPMTNNKIGGGIEVIPGGGIEVIPGGGIEVIPELVGSITNRNLTNSKKALKTSASAKKPPKTADNKSSNNWVTLLLNKLAELNEGKLSETEAKKQVGALGSLRGKEGNYKYTVEEVMEGFLRMRSECKWKPDFVYLNANASKYMRKIQEQPATSSIQDSAPPSPVSAEDEEVNDVLDWYDEVYHITFTRKNKPAQVEAILDMLQSGYLGKEITFSLGIMADSDYWGQRGIPTFMDLDAQTGQHYLGKGRKRLAEKEKNHREAVAREIPERIQFFKMKEKDSKYMLQGKRKGAINLWYYFNMPEWEYYRDVKLYEEDFSPRAWEVYQKWVAFFKNRWDDPDRPSNLDELQNEEIKHHAEIQKAKWEQEKKAKEWHDGELPADFRYTGLAAEEEEYYQEEPAIAANQAVEAAG